MNILLKIDKLDINLIKLPKCKILNLNEIFLNYSGLKFILSIYIQYFMRFYLIYMYLILLFQLYEDTGKYFIKSSQKVDFV